MTNVNDSNGYVSIANGTNEREARPHYWIACRVQMNREKRVGEELTKMGIENYVPTQTEIHQWSDRKKKVERIVIPMIVFACVNKVSERTVRTFSYISSVLSYPGHRESAHIPEEQMTNLKFMLRHSENPVEFNAGLLSVGEQVEVIRGSLKGLRGELSHITPAKSAVVIRIDAIGFASVTIDRNDIVLIPTQK